MILPRIIPCLLLKGEGLVKGQHFSSHRYIGDPINAVQLFNTMEVDELLFLDITATKEKRTVPLSLVQKLSDQCLMPFGVGGGIDTLDKAKQILALGAEKVCLNTAAIENPSLINAISSNFGNQSVLVSIDIKRTPTDRYEVYTHCGTKKFSSNLEETIRTVEKYGAGEILINDIDKDGTMDGYDLKLISHISSLTRLPVIACGGAGTYKDLTRAISTGKASAAAAGSLFVFHGPRKAVLINYPNTSELKKIRGE